MRDGAGLESYLRARRELVERALDAAWPPPPATPALLDEAMRYSLFAGGKRVRPILVLASAEAVAGAAGAGAAEREADLGALDLAMPAACAVEMIHTYSLIHDDLPAMDNDSLRRGRPTSHVVYGDGLAILAGDALQAEAFALLAREPAGDAPWLVARRLGALAVIARGAGSAGMAGGQVIDLEAAGQVGGTRRARAVQLDEEGLRRMDACKTGALIRASTVAGAVMAGGTPGQVAAVDDYAAEIGLAFQIVDDILDVEGSTAGLGKTAGKDQAAGKPTYVSLYGLDESRRLAEACLDRAMGALDRSGLGGSWLGPIATWLLGRSH